MGAVAATPASLPDTEVDLHALERRLLKGAAERIQADYEQALRLGFIDKEGNPTSNELPEDMLPGADRDFGG